VFPAQHADESRLILGRLEKRNSRSRNRGHPKMREYLRKVAITACFGDPQMELKIRLRAVPAIPLRILEFV